MNADCPARFTENTTGNPRSEFRIYAARMIFNRVRFAVAAEQRLNDSVSDWRNLRAERLLPLLWFPLLGGADNSFVPIRLSKK